MKKKSKAGSIAYALFLFIYIAAVLAVGYFLLTKLWNYAEEYERSRPNLCLDAFIEDLNENLWNEGLAETVSSMPHEFQTDEEVTEIIKQRFSDSINYVRTSGGDEHTRVYAIRCGNNQFGTVTIQEDRSVKSEYDMYPWVVVDQEYEFTGLYSSVSITVPRSYSVTLNGRAMGPEYIVQDNIHFSMLEDYYDEYPDLPVMVTYAFDHVIGELEPVAYDENGNAVEIDESRGEAQFLGNCSQEEIAHITEFVTRFADHYAHYSSGMGEDAAASYGYWLSAYILRGSDLDKRMIAAQDGLYWARASSVEVTSLTINSIIRFGEGIYLCDYSDEVRVMRSSEDITQNNVRIIIVDNEGDTRVAEYNQY